MHHAYYLAVQLIFNLCIFYTDVCSQYNTVYFLTITLNSSQIVSF